LRESPFGFNFTVGLNSDESVRRLKGPDRPVYPLQYRVEVLESICYVGWVEVFEEDTPLELIKRIKPDIIVKGGDYKPEDVVGKEYAEVRIFPLMEV
jgi:D-beta-D-heptose 7-phosphate kinase/D-beta-D-heptose 1-phosphate adenosyltransferase